MSKIKQLLSEYSYNELVKKVKENTPECAFDYIFPAICKALEEGNGDTRERILNDWLDMDSVRVCTTCGNMMSEGWYLNDAGYACSDECAAKSEGISMDEFKRYRIYKDDIKDYLHEEGDTRDISELSDEEINSIIENHIIDNVEYFYTEWY